jgi:hypothetical protein
MTLRELFSVNISSIKITTGMEWTHLELSDDKRSVLAYNQLHPFRPFAEIKNLDIDLDDIFKSINDPDYRPNEFK